MRQGGRLRHDVSPSPDLHRPLVQRQLHHPDEEAGRRRRVVDANLRRHRFDFGDADDFRFVERRRADGRFVVEFFRRFAGVGVVVFIVVVDVFDDVTAASSTCPVVHHPSVVCRLVNVDPQIDFFKEKNMIKFGIKKSLNLIVS